VVVGAVTVVVSPEWPGLAAAGAAVATPAPITAAAISSEPVTRAGLGVVFIAGTPFINGRVVYVFAGQWVAARLVGGAARTALH
jgi:hypothetical protein